jgi:glycosyltransferase involved in cell wall biosynthesis
VKILCMTHYFPLPPDRGGAIRVFGLLRALASKHDVHLLVTRPAEDGVPPISEVEDELGISAEAFPSPSPRRSIMGRAALWAESIARRTPPWVLAQFNRRLRSRGQAIAQNFEAIVILDDYAGVYAPALRRSSPKTPIIVDKPVVLAAFPPEGPASDRLEERARDRLGRLLTTSFERRYLGNVDSAVVTSDEEAERFRRLYAQPPEVVPSAIDLPGSASLQANRSRDSAPLPIGWIGSLDGEPIVEGLKRFIESAWQPLGRDGFQLLVAGRNPPPSVEALKSFPGVNLLGYVDNLDSFLDSLGAAVVPLWAGQGIKLKTLTLLGAGLPMAATTVALEGIPAVDGRHCLIADDPAGLADGLRRISSDPKHARQLGKEGRRLVADCFTWDTAGPRFLEIVERVVRTSR